MIHINRLRLSVNMAQMFYTGFNRASNRLEGKQWLLYKIIRRNLKQFMPFKGNKMEIFPKQMIYKEGDFIHIVLFCKLKI